MKINRIDPLSYEVQRSTIKFQFLVSDNRALQSQFINNFCVSIPLSARILFVFLIISEFIDPHQNQLKLQ